MTVLRYALAYQNTHVPKMIKPIPTPISALFTITLPLGEGMGSGQASRFPYSLDHFIGLRRPTDFRAGSRVLSIPARNSLNPSGSL